MHVTIFPAYNSISMIAFVCPYFTYSPTSFARARKFVLPPSPRQMAQTILDLPVPFGPMITFSFGFKEN